MLGNHFDKISHMNYKQFIKITTKSQTIMVLWLANAHSPIPGINVMVLVRYGQGLEDNVDRKGQKIYKLKH